MPPLYNPRPTPEFEQARKRAILRVEVTIAFMGGEQRTMDLRPGLARVACPTLVLGGALDPVCPPKSAEEMMAALPPGVGRLELVPTAGHGVHRDEPELAESIFRRFFAEARGGIG